MQTAVESKPLSAQEPIAEEEEELQEEIEDEPAKELTESEKLILSEQQSQ